MTTSLGQLLSSTKNRGDGLINSARALQKELIYKPTAWDARMTVGRIGRQPRVVANRVVNYDAIAKMFRGSVFICASAIANKAASVGVKVNYVRDGRHGPIREHVSISHPLYELLMEPRPGGTLFNFLYEISLWLQLYGDAYFRMHKNWFGIPDRLELLSPQWVDIIPGEDDVIESYRVHTLYMGTEAYEVKRKDMVHFQNPNPDKSSNRRFYGLSTCLAMEQTINLEEAMYSRLNHKMSNYARPGMVFATKKRLNEIQLKQHIEAIMNQHRLAEHEGRPMVLHDEMELVAGGDNAREQELDFRGSLEDTLKLTSGGFGVPLAVVGLAPDQTRSNAEASLYSFAHHRLNPHLTQISQVLTNQLAHRFAPDLEIQVGPFDVRDYRELVNAMQVGARIGLFTTNEGRQELYGMPPLENGGDNIVLPAGVMESGFGNLSDQDRLLAETR